MSKTDNGNTDISVSSYTVLKTENHQNTLTKVDANNYGSNHIHVTSQNRVVGNYQVWLKDNENGIESTLSGNGASPHREGNQIVLARHKGAVVVEGNVNTDKVTATYPQAGGGIAGLIGVSILNYIGAFVFPLVFLWMLIVWIRSLGGSDGLFSNKGTAPWPDGYVFAKSISAMYLKFLIGVPVAMAILEIVAGLRPDDYIYLLVAMPFVLSVMVNGIVGKAGSARDEFKNKAVDAVRKKMESLRAKAQAA